MAEDRKKAKAELLCRMKPVLLDFAVSCLVDMPEDVIEHGYKYFDLLRKRREISGTELNESLNSDSAASATGSEPSQSDQSSRDFVFDQF